MAVVRRAGAGLCLGCREDGAVKDASIPENGIYGMTDEQLQAAISSAEDREVQLRNLLSELRLHRTMRRHFKQQHVKQQHIKENILALQSQLEQLSKPQ